jgi:myosin heavy subunit
LGASEKEKKQWFLLKAEQYNYLNQGKCMTIEEEGFDESTEFDRVKQSFELLGFKSNEINDIFRLLSAFLLLGNITFEPNRQANNSKTAPKIKISNPVVLRNCATLLGTSEDMLSLSLTFKRLDTRKGNKFFFFFSFMFFFNFF